jgi:Domain of unknown function DUF29
MAKALHRPDPDLYERDFHAWLVEQAGHARAGRVEALDLENIAEELEGLARSDQHAIESRMDRLVTHLLKLGYVSDQGPRRGWVLTVNEQRRRIRRLIKSSPSLAGYPAQVLGDAYAAALEDLEGEPGLPPGALPARCPFTIEQVLDRRFVPAPSGE